MNENVSQKRLSKLRKIYPHLSEMELLEKSRSTLKITDKDMSEVENSSKYADDYAKFPIDGYLNKYDEGKYISDYAKGATWKNLQVY